MSDHALPKRISLLRVSCVTVTYLDVRPPSEQPTFDLESQSPSFAQSCWSLCVNSIFAMLASINFPWLLAITIAAIALYTTKHSKTRNLPDGPAGLPLVGVLPDRKLQLHQQLLRYVPIYGDFFSFNMGRSKVIVLSSPTAIDDLIVKKGQNFSSRPSSSSQAKIVAQDRLVQMEYGDSFRVRHVATKARPHAGQY
jgi:hypothetical protein